MWPLLFWGSILLTAYCYFGYPASLYIIGKLRGRPPRVDGEGEVPSVCLVISAHNEDRVIREKIENSLSQVYPADRFGILVASDGSTDDTTAIASEYEGAVVRVRHWPENRGKSAVLNDVLRESGADVMVFTDANALFATDAVEKLARHFADPEVGCVVGRLRYVERGSTSVGKGENVYWKYEALLSRLESRLGSVLIANGSIFAVRRELVRELFAEVANDFQIPVDVGHQGYRVLYDPEAVAVEHTAAQWQEEFDRKVRIVLRGLTGFSMLKGRIRGLRLWQFLSRKMLRWQVGMLLGIAFVSNMILAETSLVYTAALAVQVLFYLAALNGWMTKGSGRPGRLSYIPFYFTLVNASALIATVKFLGGARQSTWRKAESTRVNGVDRADIVDAVRETHEPGAHDDATESPRAKVAKQ